MNKPKLLIVEDERVVAEDIRMCLEDAGYDVCGLAKRGADAIDLAREHHPDLALLDIVLRGDLDGIAVAQELRTLGIPFVFLTAYSQQEVINRAKETNPFAYLTKPFDQSSLLSTVDIALHKSRLDRQLQDSREWFYTLLHSIGDGVIATDPEGNVVFMNGVAEHLSGWTSEDARHRPIEEVFRIENEDSRTLVDNPARKALKSSQVVGLDENTILLRPDGSQIPIDDSGSPIINANGDLVGAVLIFRDISARKEAQREVRLYQEHLEDLVDRRTDDLHRRVMLEELISSISIELLDLSDDDLDRGINQAIARTGAFLGMDRCAICQRVLGGDVAAQTFHPTHAWRSDSAENLALGERFLSESSWCLRQVREQGRCLLGSPSELPENVRPDAEILAACDIQSLAVFPINRINELQGVICMASADSHPWRQSEMRLLDMFVQIVRSALDRQTAAREKLQLMEELNQANKLEAIGKLTGGIAHDFNNMLLPIIGYSDMLLTPNRTLTTSQDEIREIRKAAESAAALTRQLLAFSRKQILEKEPMDLNALILEKSTLLARVLGEDVDFQLDLDHDAGLIEADRGQMDQVLMNLCVNARDAMPDGGLISIHTSRVFSKGRATGESVAENDLRVTIRDTGTGMDGETLERIFDPFFTTKGMDGTGLGLSVVFGIIEQHGGLIEVSSTPGQGTQFEIRLPLVAGAVARSSTSPVPSGPCVRGGQERILLIEDEPSVIAFVQAALRKQGYQVTPAMSVTEARRVFDECQGHFDLIFSDAMLPDGTGMEILRDLLISRPHLKGLLSSGYTDHRALVDAARANNIAFLHKPYSLTSLYETVSAVLEQDRPVLAS